MADNKVKLITKVDSFESVQKCFQNIENVLNKLTDAINKPAESIRKETEGKTGDIKCAVEGTNAGADFSIETRTEKGWQSPIIKPHFDSGWIAAAINSSYIFKHHLGSRMLLLQVYLKDGNGNVLNLGGDSFQGGGTPADRESGISIYMKNSSSIDIGTGNDAIFIHDNTSLGVTVTSNIITSGHLRVLAWKTGIKV